MKNSLRGFANAALRRLMRNEDDPPVMLGSVLQRGMPFTRVEPLELWRRTPLLHRLRSVLLLHWEPSAALLEMLGREAFARMIFGDATDFGPELLALNSWRYSQPPSEWELPPDDERRAHALEVYTTLTRLRLADAHAHGLLSLRIAEVAPFLCELVFPMVIKVPVLSLRTHVEIDAGFAFAAIRRADHPYASDLVAFLYELLYLQQKITASLDEFLRAIDYARQNKRDAALIVAEANALMYADVVFVYLKASAEKLVAFVGAVFGVPAIAAKREHKKRIAALVAAIPAAARATPYCAFFLDLVSSESLEDVNAYRSGILHKKGIADLQPHNYVSSDVSATPFERVFSVMRAQHARNTAALVCGLAMLTDDLVTREPPKVSLEAIAHLRELVGRRPAQG